MCDELGAATGSRSVEKTPLECSKMRSLWPRLDMPAREQQELGKDTVHIHIQSTYSQNRASPSTASDVEDSALTLSLQVSLRSSSKDSL